MYKHFNNKINAHTITILPGEFYSSSKNEIIYTVLGSCISVTLYDPVLKAGGMNHFMLPQEFKNNTDYFKTQSGRYGINAMELLINSLLKIGAVRSRLNAKIFGGSNVLNVLNKNKTSVAEQNIEFAYNFLRTEKIPIISSDIGGKNTRKIFFYTGSGKVYQQKLFNKDYNKILSKKLKKLNDDINTGNFTAFE